MMTYGGPTDFSSINCFLFQLKDTTLHVGKTNDMMVREREVGCVVHMWGERPQARPLLLCHLSGLSS